MWQRFKASFNSREHMRDYLLASCATVMLVSAVVLFVIGWFVL